MALCSRPCKPLSKHICAIEISVHTALTCRRDCTHLCGKVVSRAHLPRPRFDGYGAGRKMLVVDRPKNTSKPSLRTSMIATKFFGCCDIPHRDGDVRCKVHQPSLRDEVGLHVIGNGTYLPILRPQPITSRAKSTVTFVCSSIPRRVANSAPNSSPQSPRCCLGLL